MARLSGGAGGEPEHYFDYVQQDAPAEPVEAETWYDTDDDEAKVYTGTEWQLTNLVDHTNLSGVGAADHHSRPTGTQNGGGHSTDTHNFSASSTSSWRTDVHSVNGLVTHIWAEIEGGSYEDTCKAEVYVGDAADGHWQNVVTQGGFGSSQVYGGWYVPDIRIRYTPNTNSADGNVNGFVDVRTSTPPHSHSI